ncbi:MAG: RNA polymerase sporulation sigma factor SigG [Clostridia bacterium]|nr:RNA polymerase sporulation sigma factor SigG [Clostridia bacterium]
MYNKVEICGVNTSKLKTLTTEQKNTLLIKAKNGDMAAREELINGNLKLVLSVVQKFGSRGENPDDLFQVGCIGLIKAIDNFDLSQGVLLSTYAVPMITGEIRRYLRDDNMIRVSRSVRDLAYKALGERERLSVKLGRQPTIDEITQGVNKILAEAENPLPPCTKKDISDALDAIMDPVSLFDPVYSDNGDSIFIMDQLCDNRNNDDLWTENIALNEAIKKLDSREKAILDMRFYRGKTQTEVAEEVGISQAQVSRLEKGAISRIRKNI